MSELAAFDCDSLLAEASSRTGFTDFGDDSFREPMRRLLRSMEDEGQLHEIGRLTQRFGERRLVQVGQGLTTLGLFALPAMASGGSWPVFMLLAPVLAIGTGLSHSVLPSLLTQAVGRGGHGGILGLGNSFSALGRVLGPSIAGVLFELDPRFPFWVGGALMTTCLLTALTLVRSSAGDGAAASRQP